MFPMLFSDAGVKLALIDNVIQDTAKIKRVVNGEFTFAMQAYEKDLKSEYFAPGNYLSIEGQHFDIKYIQQNHKESAALYDIQCEHVNYRLQDSIQNTLAKYSFNGTPKAILDNILAGTDFISGTVDFITPMAFIVNKQITRKGLIYELATSLGGEIDYTDNGLLDTIGQDQGYVIQFGKNLKGVSKTIDNRGDLKTTYSVDILELKNSNTYIEKQLQSLEVIEIGDSVRVIDSVIGLDIVNRIKSIEYNPLYRLNTAVEISNTLDIISDTIKRIDNEKVNQEGVYNGIKIGPIDGFVAERSDGKAKTMMSATEGISIYSNVGAGLARNFYVDTDGKIKAKQIDIDGSGTFSGSLSAASGTFTGELQAASGTFTGDISAASGTFTGDINTTESIVIGNNLYLGVPDTKGNKGLYFFDSETGVYSSTGMFMYEYDSGSFAIALYGSGDQVRIGSDQVIFLSNPSEDTGIWVNCIPGSEYITILNRSPSGGNGSGELTVAQYGEGNLNIEHHGLGPIGEDAGGGDVFISQQGTGDLIMEHSGTGDLIIRRGIGGGDIILDNGEAGLTKVLSGMKVVTDLSVGDSTITDTYMHIVNAMEDGTRVTEKNKSGVIYLDGEYVDPKTYISGMLQDNVWRVYTQYDSPNNIVEQYASDGTYGDIYLTTTGSLTTGKNTWNFDGTLKYGNTDINDKYCKNMGGQILRFQYAGGYLEIWNGATYIGRCLIVP